MLVGVGFIYVKTVISDSKASIGNAPRIEPKIPNLPFLQGRVLVVGHDNLHKHFDDKQ